MDINVTKTKVTIGKDIVNKGEYNIRECVFTLSSEYEGLVCKALFTVEKTNKTYEQSIVNNKCTIPYEVTVQKGAVTLGVIGYEIQDDELIKRYSPLPYHFTINDGSYVEDIENQAVPTPSDLEQLEQRVSAIEIDAEQVEINTQNISDLQENKADKTELEDFITKDVNDLTYYTLTTQTGSQIELSLNSTNFKMTATLKDKNGTVVNTSNEIDLPLESVVVNASYDSTTKELILTLQNGTTVKVSIADLISGLQTEITSSNKLNADLVDDSTSTNKFVTASEKTQITTNKNNITSLNTNKEDKSNKVTSLSSSSTDTQYPSAKAVYDNLVNKADKSSLVTGSGTEVTLQNTAELEFIQPPLPRGNSEQVQYSGKNLFDLKGFLTERNIQFTENNDGSLTFDIAYSAYSNVLEFSEEDISVSLGGIITNVTSSNARIILLNKSGSVVGTKYSDTSDLTNLSACKLRFDYTSLGTVTMKNIMLNAGATAEPYEPYVGGTESPNPQFPSAITNVTGDVEVLLQNKNLNRGLRYGYYDSATGQYIENQNYSCSIKPIKVKENESFIFTLDNVRVASFIYQFDSSGNFISRAYVGAKEVYSPENNVAYFHYCFKYGNISEVPLNAKGQIEYSTATTYTPHQEQTYTFPLGNQRMFLGDYLADDGIHHVKGQIELDGTVGGYNSTNNWYYLSLSSLGISILQRHVLLSNYFKYSSTMQSNTTIEGIGLLDNLSYIILRNNNFSSSQDYKNFLSQNLPIVEYELATEEITPYTTEQQQAYDEIKQALSYEEQTNISGTSDESNPLFEVQAVQYKESDYWTIAYVNGQIGNAIGGAY